MDRHWATRKQRSIQVGPAAYFKRPCESQRLDGCYFRGSLRWKKVHLECPCKACFCFYFFPIWGYKSQNLREVQPVQYNNNIVVRISSGFGELALSSFFFLSFSPDRPAKTWYLLWPIWWFLYCKKCYNPIILINILVSDSIVRRTSATVKSDDIAIQGVPRLCWTSTHVPYMEWSVSAFGALELNF